MMSAPLFMRYWSREDVCISSATPGLIPHRACLDIPALSIPAPHIPWGAFCFLPVPAPASPQIIACYCNPKCGIIMLNKCLEPMF